MKKFDLFILFELSVSSTAIVLYLIKPVNIHDLSPYGLQSDESFCAAMGPLQIGVALLGLQKVFRQESNFFTECGTRPEVIVYIVRRCPFSFLCTFEMH